MNLKTTSILFLILALLAVFCGCTATTGPTPPATVLTLEPITPLKTTTLITPLPVNEVARIKVDHFGLNPATENVYEFVGTLQVDKGPYNSVQVVLRYPDTQEYSYDLGGMGGSNQTLKSFSLFPADRYMGTNPEKVIVLDGKRYGTEYRYENGVLAWIATSTTLLSP